jgi:hypothetical protein
MRQPQTNLVLHSTVRFNRYCHNFLCSYLLTCTCQYQYWTTGCVQRLTNQTHWIIYFFIFLLRWLLHVSAKRCHPQGAYNNTIKSYNKYIQGLCQYKICIRKNTIICDGSVRSCCHSLVYIYHMILLYSDCLLPYWHWSGSERKTVTPWGWLCFAETCRSHRKRKIKKYIIQCI